MRRSALAVSLFSLALGGPALAKAPAAAPVPTAPAQPAAAAADATAKAKAYFKRGTEYYKQGKYREASAQFEAAYRAKPHPAIFFNLAQCHEKLGDVAAALRNYHDYLRGVPDAEDRPAVEVAISRMEGDLAKKGVQQLVVHSEPEGGRLAIDGLERGKTPANAELPPGPHSVTVMLEGYAPAKRDVALQPNKSMVLEVPLTKAAAPLAATTTGGAPANGTSAPSGQPGFFSRHKWSMVAAGAGVAALVVGGAFGAGARSASEDLHARVNSRARAQTLHDSAQSRMISANVFYGLAGVSAAASVTMFFLEGRF
jgi:hypothetical protein